MLVLKLYVEVQMCCFCAKFYLNKILFSFRFEKTYFLTLTEFLLGTFKVIINIQALKKFSYGVLVAILLLLNDLYQIFKYISSPFVDHNSSCKVTKKVMCICLDSIQVPDTRKFRTDKTHHT
jgi:hypothetical protein